MGTKNQPVAVTTIYEGNQVHGVPCSLKNDKGSWFVNSPGSVVVEKSYEDLVVEAKKDDMAGVVNIQSSANSGNWCNIIAGGGIGYIVDRSRGAGFDYPNSIVIDLKKTK
jgi:hypothetical protein